MLDALREQKEFFHLLAENLSDFIAVLDRDGRRLYNSPSYQHSLAPPRKCAAPTRSPWFIPTIASASRRLSNRRSPPARASSLSIAS